MIPRRLVAMGAAGRRTTTSGVRWAAISGLW